MLLLYFDFPLGVSIEGGQKNSNALYYVVRLIILTELKDSLSGQLKCFQRAGLGTEGAGLGTEEVGLCQIIM